MDGKLTLLLLLQVLMIRHSSTRNLLTSLVGKTLKLQHGDLYLISDLGSQSQNVFVTDAMETGQHPMQVVHISYPVITDLGRNHALSPIDCKNLPSKYKYWYRKNAILTLIMIRKGSSIPAFLSLLSATVARCPVDIRTGIYFRDNMLLFFIDDDDHTGNANNVAAIFADPLVQRFRNAAVICPAKSRPDNALLIYNYNFFTNEVVLNMVHSRSSRLPSLSTLFAAFNMDGYKFHMEGLPYAYHVTADKVVNPPSPSQKFTNISGYEIDMLKTLSEKLNFTYEMRNPEDMSWGVLKEGPEPHWTGMIGCVVDARCDIVISDIGITGIIKVVLPSVTIDFDSLVFVAPLPQPYFNVLTLLQPFTYTVWTLILIALAITSLTVYLVSSRMFHIYQLNNKRWNTLPNTLWFTFGMLVGQDVMKDVAAERPNQSFTTRIVIGTWFVSCAFMSAVYIGMVTSFLTTPSYETAIDTFDDVINSGLPWDIVLYGSVAETVLETTDDPVLKVIWRDKVAASYLSDTHSRLENVLQRKMIALEWHNELEAQTYIGFSTPNGRPLLHVSEHYTSTGPSVWAFYPFNPYFKRFDAIMLRMVEVGLIDEWKRRTMVDMKKKKNMVEEIERGSEKSDMILLSNMRSYFVGLALGYALALAAVLAELGYSTVVRRKEKLLAGSTVSEE